MKIVLFILVLFVIKEEAASQSYFKMSSNTYRSTNLHELWYLRDTLPNSIITEIDMIILNGKTTENSLEVLLHYDTCKNENRIETKDIKGENIKIRQIIRKAVERKDIKLPF